MGVGAEILGGGAEGQALDIKEISPRVSHGDLIVFALALLLISVGGILKQTHDNRTVSAEVGGLTVTYPRGWFRYPVEEPELLRVVSDEDGETTFWLFAEPAAQTSLSEAVATGVGNPAAGETAYTQLTSEQIDLRGNPALRTDYAYVNTEVSGSSPPEVIRGRQIAWVMNDQVHVLALEAPASVWDESQELFDPVVAQLQM